MRLIDADDFIKKVPLRGGGYRGTKINEYGR